MSTRSSSLWFVKGTQMSDIGGWSDFYLHKPKAMLGLFLVEGPKDSFHRIMNLIDEYYKMFSMRHDLLLGVVDEIDNTKKFGTAASMPLIDEVVTYLRINLLSKSLEKVKRTLVLMDVLVKNCQFRIHYAIGRKKVMKTLSKIARWHYQHRDTNENILISELALDILSAWAQAFYPRRNLYPYIVDTYVKLKNKYGIQFSRPDYDPTRVPIFLGPISYADRNMLQSQLDSDRRNPLYRLTNHSEKSNYSIPSVHEDEEEEEAEEGKKSYDEIEDLIKFDQITLTPASSNTPVQNYGHPVPSPLIGGYNTVPNQSSPVSYVTPHRGITREYSDENRSSMPILHTSVEWMASLRNVSKPPTKPPRNIKTEGSNEAENDLSKVKLDHNNDNDLSKIKLDHNNDNVNAMDDETSTTDSIDKLTSSKSKYDQRKKELRARKDVVSADHDVDIKFFGNQRYVERKPDSP